MAEGITGASPFTGGKQMESVSIGEGSIWRLVAALYVAEALAVAIPVLAFRLEGKASVGDFLTGRPGILCVGVGLVLLTTLFFIVKQCRVGAKSGSKQWLLGLVMNIAVMAGLFAAAEIGLRLLSVESNTEESIAGKLLYPRRWDTTASKFRAILKFAEAHPPFWVADRDLGWTIGRNRQSADGLYFSSAEGLRSPRLGVSYQGQSPGCRIALLGDSFTFGEEVRYEDAWASLLEKRLGGRCQVLNFGVGGYGIDQVYLKYLRDVRPWKPDLVVMSFVNHDFVRTMSVYSFLIFSGGETPFAKPRFVVRDGQLAQLNRPPIPPEEMFALKSIKDLPFIEHDAFFKETEWDRPAWSLFDRSYLFRLLTSVYPLHEAERPEISDGVMKEVDTKIFESFRAAIASDGAQELIVYLPSIDELPDRLAWEPVGLKILREGRIPHRDLTDCMAAGYTSEMFMPVGQGQHYAPKGNQVVAGCLLEPIRQLLPRG